MSYFNQEATSFLSSTTKLIQNGFDNFLTNGTISKAATSTTNDVISSGTHVIIRSQSEQTLNIIKKLIGLSVASVAVFGSAFYIGYNFAKKSHRFHVREADKNDQVKQNSIKKSLN